MIIKVSMSYFLLPKLSYIDNLENYIQVSFLKDSTSTPVINKTLYKYLNSIKGEIDSCPGEWDKYKKYTNPYEYIHTPVTGSKQSVCKLKPLSRSYYKMIEICNILNILKDAPENMNSFHLAEGPGGFIEALADMRSYNSYECNDSFYNKNDTYIGMTLETLDDTSIPGWKKTEQFLEKCPSVKIEKGITGTGDLSIIDNLSFCYYKYHSKMDLITADGGFDFSINFNQQEVVSSKLIFYQISFAIAMQKKGGDFIIKCFDTFTKISLDLIYLLGLVYEKVYIVKPNTSRYANSEKYLVCKNFKLEDSLLLSQKLFSIYGDFNSKKYISRIFTLDIPYLLVNKIEEYNAIFGQQQIECIANTLNLIDNNKFDKLENQKKINIQKCKQWCQKYKVPYNKSIVSNNIFLHNK